jgi:predicted transposase YdaD
MRTDKLYYQIFLSQPSLLAELIPGLPADCEFEYIAPVIKESEFRLDGLLVPVSDDPEVPVIFLEAQMQPDPRFYGRYFAEAHLYLYQYQVERPWRGLLILQSRQQSLGSEAPYAVLLDSQVERLYLQDLLYETQLPPVLALLQLIVLPDESVPQAVQNLLEVAKSERERDFQAILYIVEAILINKFPQFTSQEILTMLDLKEADIRKTRFYQEIFQKGEAAIVLRLLTQRLGKLSESQVAHIQGLSLVQLEQLTDVMLDLASLEELDAWLQAHPMGGHRGMGDTD